MSLWYKQPESITYRDIETFCIQRLPEGVRLDYKLEIPNDLAKVIAAFANTLGGLIVLGVEADKTTNTPTWPSTKGMRKGPGIEERITAICRDNIYPPVRPQISPIIDNPHAAGTALAVLRVDESLEAPHAVNGLIYERTGSQGTPYQLSNIDRISHLLGRRGRIEEQRIELISNELKRAVRQLVEIRRVLAANAGLNPTSPETKHPRGLPVRWASVIPVYPWRDLCTPQVCHDSLILFHTGGPSLTWQKVPGGAFAKNKIPIAMMSGKSAEASCCSLSTKGHVFAIECTTDPLFYADMSRSRRQKPADTPLISLETTKRFATQLFDVASRFYKSPKVELPGYVILSLGFHDVFGSHMISNPDNISVTTGQAFLDDDFTADVRVPLDELLDSPAKASTRLFDDLKFGFDL